MRRVSDSDIQKSPFYGAVSTAERIRQASIESQDYFCVRQLAEKICQHLRAKDYTSEFVAIYHYVWSHTRYMRDPRKIELVKAPNLVCEELLQGGRPQLDCDDMAALICALVMAVGGTCRIVTTAYQNKFVNGERQYSHVFAQAQEPRTGAWITLDPVAGIRTKGMMRRAVAAKVWPIA